MFFYDDAKKVIKEYYKGSIDRCSCDDIDLMFCGHKYKHSFHVKYVGKFILENEKSLQNLSDNKKDIGMLALMLHDLGRFEERQPSGVDGYNYKDHGILGYQLIKNELKLDLPELLLSVKHHGHLPNVLFEDPEFLMHPERKQESILKIIHLVSDADKLSNFIMYTRKFENYIHRNSKFFTDEPKVSQEVIDAFKERRLVNFKKINTLTDLTLNVMAWVFDINYNHTFKMLFEDDYYVRFREKAYSLFDDDDVKNLIDRSIEDYILHKPLK